MAAFLKENLLVVKYMINKIEPKILVDVLKEVLSSEAVDEQYVREFIRCQSITREHLSMDKIAFMNQYGSKKAKTITVDEKLKML
ncbi:MAG: hypothetical protein IIY08_08660, partial [Cellulosilyticum sp.]|nr:hypothetical protein [Cellulosilyticum sp.]